MTKKHKKENCWCGFCHCSDCIDPVEEWGEEIE